VNTTGHTHGEPARPDWLADALKQTIADAFRAADKPDEDQVRDGIFAAMRGFTATLQHHYGHPGAVGVADAYWCLTSALATAMVRAGRMLGGDWCTIDVGGIAAVEVIDNGTGEVVDDPDADLASPGGRAMLAMARVLAATANGDHDTAMAVFTAAYTGPDRGDVIASLIANLARSAGQGFAELRRAQVLYLSPDQATSLESHLARGRNQRRQHP
jgi:hypothetical protein